MSPYLSFFPYIFSNFSHIISLELVCDDIGIIGIILSKNFVLSLGSVKKSSFI